MGDLTLLFYGPLLPFSCSDDALSCIPDGSSDDDIPLGPDAEASFRLARFSGRSGADSLADVGMPPCAPLLSTGRLQ
jgi:hypothetical protein